MRSLACMLAVVAVVTRFDGCLSQSSEPAAGPPWLVATGDLNNLYVAAPADIDGTPGFQYWQRDARAMWHAACQGQGDPVAVTAYREDLMVFFSSGRYGLFGIEWPTIHPSPIHAKTSGKEEPGQAQEGGIPWTPGAACEDGLAADIFGWDASGEPLHARFEDEKWTWRRVELAVDRAKTLDLSAVRHAGRLFVIWREREPAPLTGAAAGYRLRFIYLDKNRWLSPVTSRLHVAAAPGGPDGLRTVHVASAGGTMACLFLKPSDNQDPPKWTLAAYATTDEDWHETGPVAGTIPAGPVALGRQGGRFYVAWMADGRPQVAPLDVPAARLGEFVPLAVSARGEADVPLNAGAIAVLAMTFLALVLLMATWHRMRGLAGPVSAAAAPGGAVPAAIPRRAAACVLDYLLIGFIMVPLMPKLPNDLLERAFAGDTRFLPEMLIVLGMHIVLVVAYFSATESVLGATIGKRLFGIEVRGESGLPITWKQAVIRNVFRPVDEFPAFYLLGLSLILLGPKPQRLGDRLAHTLVVTQVGRAAPRGKS